MKRTFWATVQSALNRHVKKGIAFLDKVLPDWEDKIDLERLNLSGSKCICGQIHSKVLCAEIDGQYMNEKLGFNISWDLVPMGNQRDLGWERLTNTWKREIALRQTAKATQVSSSSEIVSQFST